MSPEISPPVPEFIPHEYSAPYIAEAREKVAGRTPMSRATESSPTHSKPAAILRDLLVAVTLAVTLFTMGAGWFYVVANAPGFAPILWSVVVVLVIGWLAYLFLSRERR